MNTRIHSLAAALALLTSTLAAQAAGSLVVTPSDGTVDPGASFALEVRGSGFVDAVVGGGFDLAFDPAVLQLTAVGIDTGTWEFISSTGSIDNVAGTLSDVYFNSFKAMLPTGDFAVATLQFLALDAGTSTIRLMSNATFPFANDRAEVIDVGYGSGLVTVAAVPEPAPLMLMSLGLATLVWRRRAARA